MACRGSGAPPAVAGRERKERSVVSAAPGARFFSRWASRLVGRAVPGEPGRSNPPGEPPPVLRLGGDASPHPMASSTTTILPCHFASSQGADEMRKTLWHLANFSLERRQEDGQNKGDTGGMGLPMDNERFFVEV